jgi:hypothetical protein
MPLRSLAGASENKKLKERKQNLAGLALPMNCQQIILSSFCLMPFPPAPGFFTSKN